MVDECIVRHNMGQWWNQLYFSKSAVHISQLPEHAIKILQVHVNQYLNSSIML